eukprot:9818167-Lingulodinium_polyedra.AAC.1
MANPAEPLGRRKHLDLLGLAQNLDTRAPTWKLVCPCSDWRLANATERPRKPWQRHAQRTI